jgi:hypothetical protein
MLRFSAVWLLSLPLLAQNSTPQAASPPPPLQTAPDAVPKLSAGEAFRYAMQPFVDARSAPNDLTDADQWALGLGVSRARQECQALTATKQEGEDLLAFGRLCAFGQVLEPARTALIDYLALPKMEDAKGAHLALARVFEGLGWTTSAESQVDSLTSLFPYDADIHWAVDQVIEAAEAPSNDNAVLGPGVVDRLNNLQLPFLLKALAAGEPLKGKDSTVDPSVLVRDALRCAAAMRDAGKKKEAADVVEQIRTLASVPAIAQTASKPAIDSAFARYALFGQPVPFEALHGTLLAKPPAQQRNILRRRRRCWLRFL